MHRRQTFLRDITKQETRKSIMPCVCHHARAQTVCYVSEDPEHGAEDCNEHHAPGTFVTVAATKNDGGRDEPDDRVAAECGKLTLEIAAEKNFFHKSRSTTQCNPDNQAGGRLRTQHLSEPLGICHL